MYLLTEYNNYIPKWLKDNISKNCIYCNTPIFDNEILTQRFCPNPSCPGHLSKRCDTICKYFGVKNIGPSTILGIIRSRSIKNTYEFIDWLYKGEKPEVELWEVAKLGGIYGIDKKCREILLGYSSFEEYFEKETYANQIFLDNKDYLIYGQTFFKIKRPLSRNVVNIMITGSLVGYNNRQDFVRKCNEVFGDRLQVIDVGKRVTNVQFLIKEKHTVDHSKSALAMKNGIPIVTPIEFLTIIKEVIKDENKGV